MHAAEFPQHEWRTVDSHPFLPVKHRTAAFQPDRHHGHQDEGQGKEQQKNTGGDIEQSLEVSLQPAADEAV